MVPEPSDAAVNEVCDRYAKDANTQADAGVVSKILATWPRQNEYEAVLLKVCVINELYRTRIFGVHAVAKTIFDRGLDIEAFLANGDPEAVGIIRKTIFNGKERDNYSFATKYCHLHEPSHFAIFDGRVSKTLCDLQQKYQFCDSEKIKNLRNYMVFLDALDCLRERFFLKCSKAELDRFLYDNGG